MKGIRSLKVAHKRTNETLVKSDIKCAKYWNRHDGCFLPDQVFQNDPAKLSTC